MSEQKPQQANQLSMRVRICMIIVLPLAVIVVSSIVIYLSAMSLVTDDIYMLPQEMPVFTAVFNEDIENPVAYLNTRFAAAAASDALEVDESVACEIRDTISGDLTEAQTKLLNATRENAQNLLVKYYKTDDTTYGTAAAALADFRFSERAAEVDAYLADDHSKYILTLTYTDMPADVPMLTDEDRAVCEQLREEHTDMLTVEEAELQLTGIGVYAEADPYKDRVTYCKIKRSYLVTLRVQFTGVYESLGSRSILAECSVETAANLSWAGIAIGQEEIKIHGNGYDTLRLQTNINPDDGFELSFSSSDPSVCTVNNEGMVEAVRETPEPVTITATLLYRGKTYTDTCFVYVVNEVDSVTVKPRELTLRAGETGELTAELSPRNATIQGIIWVSVDETLATVDENGVVTALRPGTVKIIAVAKDGQRMSACTITITDGGEGNG